MAERVGHAHVTTVGCIGMCASEPLVDIEQAEGTRITYGPVKPDMIPRLIEDIRSRHTDVPRHAWADFDGIYFCTAHKAKGLEFSTVIVPGLDRMPRAADTPLFRWKARTEDCIRWKMRLNSRLIIA